jgi:hypothetical protein
MNIQTIVKIISAVFGLLGVIFLFRIIGSGDEEIKMAASMGDFGAVSPLVSLAIAILLVTVIVTLLFSLINLASSAQKLKKSLIFIGCFRCCWNSLCSFYRRRNSTERWRNAFCIGSRWVETGLRMFYHSCSSCYLSMVFSGGKENF